MDLTGPTLLRPVSKSRRPRFLSAVVVFSVLQYTDSVARTSILYPGKGIPSLFLAYSETPITWKKFFLGVPHQMRLGGYIGFRGFYRVPSSSLKLPSFKLSSNLARKAKHEVPRLSSNSFKIRPFKLIAERIQLESAGKDLI